MHICIYMIFLNDVRIVDVHATLLQHIQYAFCTNKNIFTHNPSTIMNIRLFNLIYPKYNFKR